MWFENCYFVHLMWFSLDNLYQHFPLSLEKHILTYKHKKGQTPLKKSFFTPFSCTGKSMLSYFCLQCWTLWSLVVFDSDDDLTRNNVAWFFNERFFEA